jgi:hypothetical protein
MKNKTFMNAQILKNGFSELDSEISFKHLNKFQNTLKDSVAHENTI